jgi:hypothetical protein
MKLDPTGVFQEVNHKVSEASYVVALETAKRSQNGGNCAGKRTGEKTCSRFTIKLSKEISNMAINIKDQVVQEIKSATFDSFLIQIDELTDVESCFQLQGFTRYVHSGSFKEERLFCSPLETTTKTSDILEKVSSFIESEILSVITSVGAVQMEYQLCWGQNLDCKFV